MSQYVLKNGQILIVREALPDDAEQLLDHIEQIAGESENILLIPGELGLSVEQERELLQESLHSSGSLFLVAELAGEIVGSLNFRNGKREREKHSGEMGISVKQAYWGLGIGNHLLAELVAWARAGGIVRKINLHVRVDNPSAIHLYAKHGFVQEGRIARGMCIRGEFVDIFHMGLLIDPQ